MNDFTWSCTEDRVVVRPIEDADVSPGGVVIPTQAREKPIRGEVVAIGPARLLESGGRAEVPFVVGDEVLFGRYAGLEFKVPGQGTPYLLMRQGEVGLYRSRRGL